MTETAGRAIAIVGVGAILPDAPDVAAYWQNLIEGRYSISEVDAERWDPRLYHDDDRQAPDKTYSKIGGWVRDWDWSPLEWRLPVPPKVSDAMDRTQKWAIAAAREALIDFGYPERPLDTERTAVILGNAMGGDLHYMTALRAFFPEYADELAHAPSFAALDAATRDTISTELLEGIRRRFPEITEDSMPGELANIIAGRVANLFDLHGPNFIVDAACASAMAAIDAAIEGLEEGDYDAVLTGGVDANMSSSTFVKFCKIGALSATGTRPYGDGADGFVMGEGAAVMLLRRLADAERDGDRIYAVIRGVGGASDGRGKGITAPNPVGQRLAIERGWVNAGRAPDSSTYVEGHGTSTKVGDVVEVDSLTAVFSDLGLPVGSVPLGSVKSNIGHLKGAAGAAGMLKAALALHHKTIPPSLGSTTPNPNIDFERSPLFVNNELREWKVSDGQVRAAGVSAFGFGGTNFHLVLEEHIPGRLSVNDGGRRAVAVPASTATVASAGLKAPLRGAAVIGGRDEADVLARLGTLQAEAEAGRAPAPAPPDEADLRAPLRVAIDFADAADLATKAARAAQALSSGNAAAWKLLGNQGVFVGRGEAHQTAFLYTGQGSQYVNMMAELRRREPIVTAVFDDADRIMEPLLGRPLSAYIFVDGDDPVAVAEAEEQLRQTEITQPAVLATDLALTKLLEAYGFTPDMVMGHSLGEYGALVAAGALPFADALEAVSARGKEMAHVSVDDNGLMAAVFAPLDEISAVVDATDGYVVIANLNSQNQAVIGGASAAVEAASAALVDAGHQVVQLPVSHAFHTEIVAPATEPLKEVLERLDLEPPHIPVVANVDGTFYPMGPAVVPDMIQILGRQVASPVQFVKGLHTLYDAGARNFVEVGPKRALQGFVDDVFADEADVVAVATNHPKTGDIASFNQALCALWAAGLGLGDRAEVAEPRISTSPPASTSVPSVSASVPASASGGDLYGDLGLLFDDFLQRSRRLYQDGGGEAGDDIGAGEPVVVTGAALGLPGTERVFDDHNIGRLLDGESFIDAIPVAQRRAIVDRHITRLVKSESGGGTFETIDSPDEVLKLAGRKGGFDFAAEFGYPADRVGALDTTSELAMAAGIDAMRDAGIPLVMNYKTTTTGSKLPERWGLPPALRDRTGVIFGSAFPGADRLVDEVTRFELDHGRRERVAALGHLLSRTDDDNPIRPEIEHMLHEAQAQVDEDPYEYDRRFLFKVLSMGHSQFAELIGARGPNTQINSACASTTQAFSLAEDWIRLGRCDRVIVIAADDVTSDGLLSWMGAGFLATGAAATDDVVEEAALPFDRRRHGMIVGMGAAAAVVESARSARERSLRPICEVLSTVTANSAFHGTRLDITHIRSVMEDLVSNAERRWGVDRRVMAEEIVFVSHETYTPARGGSAQAEVDALRHVFGDAADAIVVANTKGFTGHAMGAGIEDVLAVKSLETGIVPPIANVKEVDPDLGHLNLSKGGAYPVRYALRLGAGFGSQISMSLLRWVPSPDGSRREPDELGFDYRVTDPDGWQSWLRTVSGHHDARVEVVHRTLRVVDTGPPAVEPAAATPVPASAPTVARPAPQPTVTPAAPAPVPAVPAPAAPEAVSAPAVAEPAPASDVDAVVAEVLAVVAEQTGYPPEMLDLELDLEADLGIDTVKQAETFAAIREKYGIERDESLSLRDYPTLASVVGFVRDRVPGLAAGSAAPVAASAAPVAEAAPASDVDAVVAEVLAVVAEQTGYPPEMLDLELDLEADLGIDTVKQAETFAAIREKYGIERDESLSLRDYPTLASVVGFVRDRVPGLAAGSAAPVAASAAPVAEAAPASDVDAVVAEVLAVVAEQTGYPPEMLDLELDLEADLGIDTVKQAETFAAIREKYGIERDESLSLRDYPTLASVVGFVRDRVPGLAAGSAAPVAASAAPVAEAAPASDVDAVVAEVLAVVAEQTGYPPEMLDLELDLEADLGIDTVKQAETFAAIREKYGIERDESLSLRDYPTLASVVGFVRDRVPQDGTAVSASPAPGADASASAVVDDAPSDLLAGDDERSAAVPRRVVTAMRRPDLSLFAPTGIELGASSRVIVVQDTGGVGAALVGRLDAAGVDTLALEATADPEVLLAAVDAWKGDAEVHGLYWLAALDVAGPVVEMDLDTWHDAVGVRVTTLYRLLRHLYDDLGAPGAFVVAGTRLGGRHGYDDSGAVDPIGGGVVGVVKSFRRERPDVMAKAVDFAISRKTAALADVLVAETERDAGVMEVGVVDDQRYAVGTVEQAMPEPATGIDLDANSVFVVTGAAGSIVSAIVADLARASHGTFHLLDLVPEPDRDDPDLVAFGADKDGLKRTIFERLKAAGEKATPVAVERQLSGIERAHAALSAIRAVEQAGGTVHYHSVNLLDADVMADVTADIVETSGKVDVLLHAGGIEISKALPDKAPAEFDLVFGIKTDGWFHLMKGLRDVPLGATVVFSSVAGRYGNAGQSDYSGANDLLCKMTSNLRTARSDTLGLAFDWTAWGDIGMATRGSIPTVMKAAGIDMLPAAAGIPVIRRELTGQSGTREQVVGLRLGVLVQELAPAGGIDPQQVASEDDGPRVLTPTVVGIDPSDGLTVTYDLDPTAEPFLDHHRIDETAVLPGVMGIEAFATAARLGFPSMHVLGVEDVEFAAPCKFYRDEPRTLKVVARFAEHGEEIVAHCQLIGERLLANQDEPQVTVHFRGRVRLGTSVPSLDDVPVPEAAGATAADADDVYRIYFHGPAYQVLDQVWRTGDDVVGSMVADLPAEGSDVDATTTIGPRLIELCFQTAGVWEIGTTGSMALPAGIARVHFGAGAAEGRVRAVIRPADDDRFEAMAVDDAGHVLVRLDGYRTIQLPGQLDDGVVAPLRSAMVDGA